MVNAHQTRLAFRSIFIYRPIVDRTVRKTAASDLIAGDQDETSANRLRTCVARAVSNMHPARIALIVRAALAQGVLPQNRNGAACRRNPSAPLELIEMAADDFACGADFGGQLLMGELNGQIAVGEL